MQQHVHHVLRVSHMVMKIQVAVDVDIAINLFLFFYLSAGLVRKRV